MHLGLLGKGASLFQQQSAPLVADAWQYSTGYRLLLLYELAQLWTDCHYCSAPLGSEMNPEMRPDLKLEYLSLD